MRKILVVLFTFLIQFAYADQWYVLEYKEAVQARNLLDKQEYLLLHCQCCNNDPFIYAKINRIRIDKFDSYNVNEDYYNIAVEGVNIQTGKRINEGVDLAYVHLLKSDGNAYNVAGELLWDVKACKAPFRYNTDIIKQAFKTPINELTNNRIYVNNRSYPAINTLDFIQTVNSHYSTEGDFKEGPKLTIAKKSDSSGIILLEKANIDFFSKSSKLYLNGTLWIYLENGEVIKCLDRGNYGYIDDTSSNLYYLTNSEINSLINNKIQSISYSLKDYHSQENNNFSATLFKVMDEDDEYFHTDYQQELKSLFSK